MKRGLAIAAFLLISCHSRSSIPAAHREFFATTEVARLKVYKKYSLREQYEIMQIGNSVVHPPMVELVDWFAENGRSAVPLLKEQLGRTHDDITIRNIADVILLLDKNGLYDSSRDAVLVEALRKKTDEYPGVWSNTTKGLLIELERTDEASVG